VEQLAALAQRLAAVAVAPLRAVDAPSGETRRMIVMPDVVERMPRL
jgi:hypothetical protein